jgi:phage/plasmid-associated DNA primase
MKNNIKNFFNSHLVDPLIWPIYCEFVLFTLEGLYNKSLSINKTNISYKKGNNKFNSIRHYSTGNINSVNNNNNKVINNNLNVWDIAEDYIKFNPNFKFCTVNKCFYNYDKINKVWYSISVEDVRFLLLNFIMNKYPKSYKFFNPKNVDGIILLLQKNNFSLPNAKNKANSSGLLISFKNCVLNCNTKETFEHKPEFYITHTIQCEYDPNAVIVNTPMAEFLRHICNNSHITLAVLRACLYLILTNNLSYQVALYLYGPGGTGKSTFTNLLIYLLGPSGSITTSLRSLQSRFGASSLRDKLLLLISELPLYLGLEPQILKNIIGGDILNLEEKYKNPTQILPNVFLVITSNSLWNLKNISTGMARRFIYFPFFNKPKQKILDLFSLTQDHKAKGILVNYLPGFINWILNCPINFLELLHEGGEHATSLINPDSLIKTNPIKAWALERLVQDSKGLIKIGSNGSGLETLYGNYVSWCRNISEDVGEVNSTQFSPLLLSVLSSMDWSVEKSRTNSGYIIRGVRLIDSNIATPLTINNFVPITDKDFNDE